MGQLEKYIKKASQFYRLVRIIRKIACEIGFIIILIFTVIDIIFN